MRVLSKVILLTLISGFLVFDRANPRQHIASINKDQPLQLRVKVVGEQYCIGDSELDGLRLKVRLVYTNQGNDPIILFKGSTAISRLMVSHDFAAAAANRFEIDSSLTQVTSGGQRCYNGPVPTGCFVSLQPRGSYEVETTIGLFVVKADIREITGAVKSGDHVLQVRVPTWHESDELAKKLSSRWQRNGMLWYEPVTSEPILFTVTKDHTVVDCP